MDPLYVVEMDVTCEDAHASPGAAFMRIKEHVVEWLDRDSGILATDELTRSGSVNLPLNHEHTRTARWTTTGTTQVEALALSVMQALGGGSGAAFVCELTVYRDATRTALRIELGRESVGGILAPARINYLRRPGVMRNVLSDQTLLCYAENQRVDGRYIWITEAQVPVLHETLRLKRLPLLLVDAAADGARDFGGLAARELAGLVQVVLLPPPALRAASVFLEDAGAGLTGHGARLVWPDLAARHPGFSGAQVRSKERTVESLMRMVAPLSVVVRGRNDLQRAASRAVRVAGEEKLRRAIEAARERGDERAELGALRERNESLVQDVAQWMAEVEQLEEKLDNLQRYKAEAEYWREQALIGQAAQQAPGGVVWADAPELGDDLDDLARFLEEASQGAIVFTPAAARGWRHSRYPHRESMHDALVTLAQAAAQWREANCSTGGMVMDDWFKTAWSLNFAGTDRGLRQAGLDQFEHDGRQLRREPHLKLDWLRRFRPTPLVGEF